MDVALLLAQEGFFVTVNISLTKTYFNGKIKIINLSMKDTGWVLE